jgi:hypothetical protein
MIDGVETRLDGTTLVIHIPMRFQRRGGRKRIVAPHGNEIEPATRPRPDSTLVKALARAWRWERMLEEGEYVTIRDLARREDNWLVVHLALAAAHPGARPHGGHPPRATAEGDHVGRTDEAAADGVRNSAGYAAAGGAITMDRPAVPAPHRTKSLATRV